ncbi:hypothetical protein N7492_006881 [Penicillium capsulatum]|uniref:Zinc transporter n=1 Tax=Penicillium capsulatum TaxID=69766 RepID=A0A9W9HYS1_9EURO|nr:hypothetical protein N7492_006881 [Penicillium capsulatum]
MASTLPLPVPPRTPTPPADEVAHRDATQPKQGVSIDRDALSPLRESFPKSGSLDSTGSDRLSPTKPSFGLSPGIADSPTKNASTAAGPFNFDTTVMAKSPVMKSNIGQRRGHKYKHSKYRTSMSKDQKTRFWWSVCHMFVAAYTLWTAHGSLAMTALSHLILFDSLGALLCVAVDVLGNFEVWKRSSIRHPFGLERAEVLAGFAMCVLLLFMGLDLISHNLQHFLEKSGHEPHHEHDHERVSLGSVDITAVLAISSTLISAIGLKNHARIGKAMRFAYIESLPSVLSNPSHFLTLSCSTLLLLLPLVSIRIYDWLDKFLSGTIAISMCVLGVCLVKTLGSMLLMSYSGQGVSDVIKDIEAEPSVFGVDDARFWQVHYGLCMANLRLRVSGSEDNISRLREKISSLIRNRLGGGYGTGGQKWEVSLQFTIERS